MQKSCLAIFRGVFLGSSVLALLSGSAPGQNLAPSTGSIFPSADALNRRHMTPAGKNCLTISGSAKSQAINAHIYEHWVGVSNICGQNIKLQVCYHNSQDCIAMSVPPWGRKDAVLGIYPALQDFRFDSREQF
jgi:hypothetical protein